MFYLDNKSASEFYEVYNGKYLIYNIGVLPEYQQMVKELCEGPCIALEVR